jgi:hypothetical protein
MSGAHVGCSGDMVGKRVDPGGNAAVRSVRASMFFSERDPLQRDAQLIWNVGWASAGKKQPNKK